MERLVGRTVRIVVDNYFDDDFVIERIESYIEELCEYRTVYVQHVEKSLVVDFLFEQNVSTVAMAVKLSFAKRGLDVILLP